MTAGNGPGTSNSYESEGIMEQVKLQILVTVDHRKCMANQTCSRLAPGMFELGAAGYSRPTRSNWDEPDLPALRSAEENCPTGAVRVEVADPADC
jgi:ferredoxin